MIDQDPTSLAELEQRLKRGLKLLNHPPTDWVPKPGIADGSPQAEQSDVVIVGGGLAGITAAFALLRMGVRSLRVLDKSPAGYEGPWVTYARMETLRSPKQLTGPAMGLPDLTIQAWYIAQFGQPAWDALDKMPRTLWMDYLRWYRRVLDLPVENGVEVTGIRPLVAGFELAATRDGKPLTIACRRLILANGRDGLGGPFTPEIGRDLPRDLACHSADEIDFEALRGRRVVVVGAGASAVDNAAEALEHGASHVRMLVRRAQVPRINKMMGIGSPGLSWGTLGLTDEWRWRFMFYSVTSQTPPPRGSMLRMSRHANFSLHVASPIQRIDMAGQSLRLTTPKATYDADFLIFGTGFQTDLSLRPELAAIAPVIAHWHDRYSPPSTETCEELSVLPYLGPWFDFTELKLGTAPWLRNLYCFNFSAVVSQGKLSGDIPAISEGATRLAEGITRSLFAEDCAEHYRRLEAYSIPELRGDEWTEAVD